MSVLAALSLALVANLLSAAITSGIRRVRTGPHPAVPQLRDKWDLLWLVKRLSWVTLVVAVCLQAPHIPAYLAGDTLTIVNLQVTVMTLLVPPILLLVLLLIESQLGRGAGAR